MTLSYARYIDLMSALDEYSNSTLEKKDLQDTIYEHYINKYPYFIAENAKGSKRVFFNRDRYSKHVKTTEKKYFRKHMNEDYE